MHHKAHKQMSEAFLTAAFLSISGGLQDAYTYLARGNVFANAQTGNIVLLSQHIVGLETLLPLFTIWFRLSFLCIRVLLLRSSSASATSRHSASTGGSWCLAIEILLLFAGRTSPRNGPGT